MSSENKKSPDIFTEGLETVFEDGGADSVYQHHNESMNEQSSQILDGDIIEAEDGGEAVGKEPTKKAKAPLSKNKKTLIWLGVGFTAFSALVLILQPNNASDSIKPPESFNQQSNSVQSRFTPEPLAIVHAESVQVISNEAPLVEVQEPQKEVEGPSSQAAYVEPHKKPTQETEKESGVETSIPVEGGPSNDRIADLERQVFELRALVPISKPEVKKTEVEVKRDPLPTKVKRTQRSSEYLGDAIGVVSILDDGLVFRSKGKFVVIKIGESYKNYGDLISVDPNSFRFKTTRGLWSVPK